MPGSHDAEGRGAGVGRQVADCRDLADSLGWGVDGEYVDNDMSAFTGMRRPEYERMMSDLADGLLDGVIVYNIDRLTRRPAELETFADAVTRAGVRQVKFVTGDMNLDTDDGLLMARVSGAFAAKESANTSRRLRRKAEQTAAEGLPHPGALRPFGYAADFITIDPVEAEILRDLVGRFLAGESTRSLSTWLNDQDIATVTGRPWRTSTLKGVLINPRHAGLRAHRGVVVGPAVWKPILTEDEHRRVLAKFAEKKTSGRRTPQRYLLSGVLRCGKCGARLYSSARKTTRRYVCLSGPDHSGGCGRLTVVADPLERLIADMVLYRLDTPELADALAGRSSADVRTQELILAHDQATERLEELAAAYGQGEISMPEWLTAKKPIQQRLEATQRQLSQVTRTGALNGLAGHGAELGRSWAGLNLSRQHAIATAIIDHVTIGAGTPGARTLDPARVAVTWRH